MRRAITLFAAASALLAATPGPLSARTLAAADGRTIEAEVLGFDGVDKVRIKRADTGQTFTLPIATFAEADQTALRAEAAEAAAKPAALHDGDLTLELGRRRFDTRKSRKDVTMQDGTVSKGLLAITDEDWGFSITLKNNTLKPIEGLRADYVLFTKVDEIKNTGREARIRQKKFTLKLDPIAPGDRGVAKSEPVTTRKTELKGGFEWAGTGDNDTRDTLEGIWLRVYQGDKLVLETSSPATFMATGKWPESAN